MVRTLITLAAGAVLGAVCMQLRMPAAAEGAEGTAGGRVFELRVYTTHPGRLDALNQRFRNHTMKLFEKHGMKNVIYLTPQDGEKKDNTLVYLISHADRAAADKSWAAFRTDPEWQAVQKASEQDGKIVAKVEATYLLPTDYSPIQK